MPASSESASHSVPENPADRLREVVAGLIDVVATQGGKAIDSLGLRMSGVPSSPAADVCEDAEAVLVFVDLPGVDPQQVEILLTGNMLTVKGEYPPHGPSAGQTIHRHERPVGPFTRSIPLPVGVNADQVTAESRHGVLTIRAAKVECAKSRPIPIEIRST